MNKVILIEFMWIQFSCELVVEQPWIQVSILPEWICNLTDNGEWLHTGSRRSTQATAQTETLYMNGNSGMAKQNKFSSL